MNFHGRIMNIQVTSVEAPMTPEQRSVYKRGHRDARHAAAEIANEADEQIQELAESLEDVLNYDGGADSALEDEYVMERAQEALAKARGGGEKG